MNARWSRSMLTAVAWAGVSSAVSAVGQKLPNKMPHTALDRPEFVSARDAAFMSGTDVLIGVSHGGVAKAYPAADVGQHGSVHDRMADGPIAVTWCWICNTGVVFRMELNGRLLHFDSEGVEGLVGSNEVFKDRETGSRWQQSTATAISGPLKGTQLDLHPYVRTTWAEWKRQHPDTLVLKPLPGYAELLPSINKRINQTRFGGGAVPEGSFSKDQRLPPLETVAGLEIGGETTAYPFSVLRKVRVVNEIVGGFPIVIVHQPESDTTTAFESRLKDRTLHFQPIDPDASKLMDTETKSTWTAYGLCISGPSKGAQLKPVILIGEFWFAWSGFHPKTNVYNPVGKN